VSGETTPRDQLSPQGKTQATVLPRQQMATIPTTNNNPKRLTKPPTTSQTNHPTQHYHSSGIRCVGKQAVGSNCLQLHREYNRGNGATTRNNNDHPDQTTTPDNQPNKPPHHYHSSGIRCPGKGAVGSNCPHTGNITKAMVPRQQITTTT
jgi:hypothetical protein